MEGGANGLAGRWSEDAIAPRGRYDLTQSSRTFSLFRWLYGIIPSH
jgi:hypothetical protein